MSGPDGLVQWINPAFSAMCGYTLEELRGRSWARFCKARRPIARTAARMRVAVRAAALPRDDFKLPQEWHSLIGSTLRSRRFVTTRASRLWLVAREHEVADVSLRRRSRRSIRSTSFSRWVLPL